MNCPNFLLLLALTISLGGCAVSQTRDYSADDELAYAEAVKAEAREVAPIPVTETRVVPSPGQLKPLPVSGGREDHGHTHTPYEVIDEANHAARQTPDSHGYYNAIMTYDYDPGALYRVYAAPLQLTDIQLQPGEKMISQPASGDTTRWKVAASLSIENGVERQHLLITPKRPNIYTSLVISTNFRTYHLELFSYEETYMAAVNWNYPEDTLQSYNLQLAGFQRQNEQIDAAQINLNDANFAYDVRVKEGDPAWAPVRVFDNGQKTYIQFPDALMVADAPALYVKKYGTQQIVNYRVIGKYYVVDGIFPRFELRVGGQKDMDIVEILNEEADRL